MSPDLADRCSIGTTSRALSTLATEAWPVARIASASAAWLMPSIGASPAV